MLLLFLLLVQLFPNHSLTQTGFQSRSVPWGPLYLWEVYIRISWKWHAFYNWARVFFPTSPPAASRWVRTSGGSCTTRPQTRTTTTTHTRDRPSGTDPVMTLTSSPSQSYRFVCKLLGYWVSMSKPHLFTLTCEPHTIHSWAVSISDLIHTVNLTHVIP